MARDPRYDVLFEPIKIGPVTAPNRFYQVPHCNGMGRVHPTSMAHMRGMKAEGGWGIVATEQCDIHHTADIAPSTETRMWDDGDKNYLARMAEAVRAHGSLAAIELVHNSISASNLYSREVPIGPMHRPVKWTNHPVQARAMDLSDIRDYRRWHRNTAIRARDAGFNIVVVYSGHDGTLPTFFLSKRHNQRTDEYGGSLENRLRLFRELIEETKDAVGDTMAVVVRFAVDEMMGADGMEWAGEGRDAVEMLAELPDMWDVNVSDWANDSTTSRFAEEGYQEAFIGFVKQVTTKPGGRRRPLYLARRHGLGDPPRRGRRDRRGAALHRRPVPAQEDRGRPHRGYPRVHWLQYLRRLEQHGRAAPLHPEPDPGRGMAQGLAPGEDSGQGLGRQRAGGRGRPGGPRGGAGPGPAGLHRYPGRGRRRTRRPRYA